MEQQRNPATSRHGWYDSEGIYRVDDDLLKRFTLAQQRIHRIIADYERRFRAGEIDASNREELRRDVVEQSSEALEACGISALDYNRIANSLYNDDRVRERFWRVLAQTESDERRTS